MATIINMENKKTGETVKGFYGFSWTTLFFGAFPALFRKDFLTFLGVIIITIVVGCLTFGIGGFIISVAWAFMYNKYYTTNLVKKGFAFSGMHTENEIAAGRLKLKLNADNCLTVPQTTE
ncbi:hypothetical protein [Citrobacter koseri]|uniref:hypothetical protein n=1 Tax=Citrobacter koseri TaxID=545 RepID=UPI000E050E63|nr:hypothetical protein [Citrobacter koseri]STA81066.1 Protein of uncharacterised function (DUF2628) [Citrobacter koseri]STT20269.1 Protein of uncharacterised function (DUF2628) [Citrobacter koseri]